MFTTKKLFIFISRQTIIALVAVGVTIFTSSLFAGEIAHIANTIVQNRHLASALEKRIELFSTLARDAQIVGSNDVLIDRAFIPSDNILDFISSLDALALKNGVTQSFHFETPVPSSTSAPFPLSEIGYSDTLSITNVSGGIHYLKEFATLPYFTKIENLSITSNSSQGWHGPSNIAFRATVYAKTIQ